VVSTGNWRSPTGTAPSRLHQAVPAEKAAIQAARSGLAVISAIGLSK
jgi:hypothetical protein